MLHDMLYAITASLAILCFGYPFVMAWYWMSGGILFRLLRERHEPLPDAPPVRATDETAELPVVVVPAVEPDAEPVVVDLVERHAEHPTAREQPGLEQVEQPGEQLAARQVAGRPEQEDDVRVGRGDQAGVDVVWIAGSHARTSVQARLVDALRRAGGPPGYLIVVKIDDLAAPVSPEDVAELLKNGR